MLLSCLSVNLFTPQYILPPASQQLPDRQLGTKSPLDTGSPSVRDGVSGRAVVRRQTLLMLPMLFGRTATKLPGLKHG
ncbi:conserved hypothetical protein [Agrobacterium fabacearum S56]|uniref:Tiorf171 protein n=1 Tax=Agrobacterium tumefaciens TaxID=358 RepID=Q9R6A5_AGRTU|nr:tiorf171 [Agrobacterium tumefaciens]CUX06548.1 conserved hypothetical protein [Agrobacterium fabacearum S56]